MQNHAFVIEAGKEEGIKVALGYAERELNMKVRASPDVLIFEFGLLSIDDVRRINDTAMQSSLMGDKKIIIIAANRAYHEAQNALLKLFEEPPKGTFLFLVLPTLGSLLPTLRSRVQVLPVSLSVDGRRRIGIPKIVEEFLKANKEKRSAMIKKLANGKDEEERRENRDKALAIVNSVEAVVYRDLHFGRQTSQTWVLLDEIQELRGHLFDRSAPVKMILEHLSLVLPKNLVK